MGRIAAASDSAVSADGTAVTASASTVQRGWPPAPRDLQTARLTLHSKRRMHESGWAWIDKLRGAGILSAAQQVKEVRNACALTTANNMITATLNHIEDGLTGGFSCGP